MLQTLRGFTFLALPVSTLSSHAKVMLIELFLGSRLLSQGILILIAYLSDGIEFNL